MTRRFALANQKGGVGKTTTAISLGAFLAAKGERVLLVDVDPQANATSGLGFDKWHLEKSTYDVLLTESDAAGAVIQTSRRGLELLPASPHLAAAEVELAASEGRELVLRTALEPLSDSYDFMLLDCPPSLGLLTINALAAATDLIVPVQCEYLALEGLSLLLDTVGRVRDALNPDLRVFGILMTMFDPRTNLSEQVVQEVRQHYPESVFRTVIPRNVRLSEAPSYGVSILDYDAASRGALSYDALADEALERTASLTAAI
ncbi:MAG TPA: ParA family protein [Chloroflexota bacterium]|nr:ParA family protein [Chloroflexota bacterium]